MFHSSDSGHDSSESDTLMTIIQTMIQYKQHTIMIQYKLFLTLYSVSTQSLLRVTGSSILLLMLLWHDIALVTFQRTTATQAR